jgi:phosphoglycolate phosphatase-like HAD superfamily hydrolase
MLFTPRHDFLIGVDSDGCVFDSMEVKQVMHFHPLILKHWNLGKIEHRVRELAEYVNLRSPWRGSNRFIALLKFFELLEDSTAAKRPNIELPNLGPLRDWVESGESLSNENLESYAKREPELKRVLEWSLAVNQDISNRMMPVPPFDGAADALTLMHARADVVVVSLTPLAALEHEWDTHGLRVNVDGIAGQEWGTKQEQLRLAMSQGQYTTDQVLLIGDAPGDWKAAREVGVCFAPTVPGREVECWQRILSEDLDLFFNGTYRGQIMETRVAEFQAALSDVPPTEVQ